jgi:hypothetical protein
MVAAKKDTIKETPHAKLGLTKFGQAPQMGLRIKSKMVAKERET